MVPRDPIGHQSEAIAREVQHPDTETMSNPKQVSYLWALMYIQSRSDTMACSVLIIQSHLPQVSAGKGVKKKSRSALRKCARPQRYMSL